MIECCRHCRKPRRINRPRGLCWTCYYTPAVRDQYPSMSKFASRATSQDFHGTTLLPESPTEHLPGSEGKLEDLAKRVAARKSLHHPRDARIDLS